jgi:hypothetical protein
VSGGAEYPEHDKLRAVRVEREAVQSFIDWMFDEAGLAICERSSNRIDNLYWPVTASRADIIARHFGIDATKLDDEKRAMIDRLREMNTHTERPGAGGAQ